MADISPGMLERFLTYNRNYVSRLRRSRKFRWVFAVSAKMRRLYSECGKQNTPEEENAALAAVLNLFEEGPVWRANKWMACFREDFSLFIRQFGKRKTIDRSDKNRKDYYSIALIVKNEARYLREYILFYQATGADRIYLYDNDSTDDLMNVLDPFLKSGFVIYRKWPGRNVQAGAYRDALRRTRSRTKWLALIDADEFLFSPKGSMPDQLKAYENYPGVGANWVIYGPNGHEHRPDGLVMDAYTAAFADTNSGYNCHIKSIVQPRQVFIVYHPHFSVYKGKGYAVGEDYVPLDNRSTRSFSLRNNREIFRINHYNTKSLEELREKCSKGYPDGSPNAKYEDLVRIADHPMTEDYSIKPYADYVRERYREC